VFGLLKGYAQKGGGCLVLGEPGTGKSILRRALLSDDHKCLITPIVDRTLDTFRNTLRILCEAFQIEFVGREHAYLRKLRLLRGDLPHSHNLVLSGQPPLLLSLTLSIKEGIRSRVTYSALLPRLSPEATEAFMLAQLDQAGLGHNQGSPGPDRALRRRTLAPNPQPSRGGPQIRIIDLKQLNRVVMGQLLARPVALCHHLWMESSTDMTPLTDTQVAALDRLERRGFEISPTTRFGDEPAPTVFLSKRVRHGMRLAQIDPDGTVNGNADVDAEIRNLLT
jgi:hypothetical protein